MTPWKKWQLAFQISGFGMAGACLVLAYASLFVDDLTEHTWFLIAFIAVVAVGGTVALYCHDKSYKLFRADFEAKARALTRESDEPCQDPKANT